MPLGASRLSLLALPQVEETPAGRSAFIVTAYGNAQVDTAYSKIGGASAYLDGTGDYLEVENDFLFGTTDDFTIEFWYKKHTTNTTEQIASNRGAYNTGHWYIQFDHTTDKIQWGVNGAAAQRSTNTFDDTNWHHFALVRDGGNFELFIDGSSEGTLTGPYTWGKAGEYYKFGQVATSHGNLSIDEIRISDSARYNAGFTPSTTAFTDDANTLLLLHCDGLDGSIAFNDDAPRTAIGVTAYNNAQVDTAQSEYGGASLSLDGSDDYLEIDGSTFMNDFANGPEFTVEYWVRPQSTSGFETHFGNWGGSSTRCFFLGSNNGTTIAFYWTDTNGNIDTTVTTGGALTRNAWNHVALVGTATEFKLYTNGVLRDSGTREDIRDQAELTKIGASATLAEDFLGHIDELRVSKVARYTGSTYTEPTSAFTNDYNTVLLLHMDGSDASTTFTDDTFTPAPLASGGDISYYNDGTDQYAIHTFTASGTFTPLQGLNIDSLIVAGGGGGGSSDAGNIAGGGGGGAQVRYQSGISVAAQNYTITIGSGGAAGANGSNSSAFSYTSEGGGGGGGSQHQTGNSRTNAAGGGGGGHWQGGKAGGTGTYAGGAGTSGPEIGGAGGGNGGVGSTASGESGGAGGIGVSSTDTFASGTQYYGGGGGGGGLSSWPVPGIGTGTHGGGDGSKTTVGNPATANTGSGGGGGGGSNKSGGTGGSGVVIVRYTI